MTAGADDAGDAESWKAGVEAQLGGDGRLCNALIFAKTDQVDGPGGFGCRVTLGIACRERGGSPGKRSDFVDMEMHGRQRSVLITHQPARFQ